jgi:hypothetical protein
MPLNRRSIAFTLSKAAQRLPAAERQQFRAFLRSLPGGEPKPRKRHSWTRKKAKREKVRRPRKAKMSAQMELPLTNDDETVTSN